ncbi:hypothetical protein GQ53DRAFT_751136 [Thozetella sp. PMI_491]|nr:hypothetical protein GQ53DRAFT_751136 [Thozetella sp. PMI_491]
MFGSTRFAALVAIFLASHQALAKTDLEGCTSTTVLVEQYFASVIYYLPDTGEICSFLDCGGGRAPPKTTKPGCEGYIGTETVTPSFLSGLTKTTATSPTGAASTASSTQPESSPTTSQLGTPSITSGAVLSSTSTGGQSSVASSTVRTGGAACATGASREVLGMIAGIAAGVALL